MDEFDPAPTPDEPRWQRDTDTFGRIYDVVLGTTTPTPYVEIAEIADCSGNAAKKHLNRLAEMGIAERDDEHPTHYRRNDAYVTWRRVESLVREHCLEELRERVEALLEQDDVFQEQYGVPDPDAVTDEDRPTDSHEKLHEHWDDLSEWQTVRRDIRVLRRAVQRAEERSEDGAHA